MRICSHCKKEKPESEFNFKNKETGLLSYQCKTCSRQYLKNHYKNNRDYYLRKARKRNKNIRELINIYIWEFLKTHPCVDCGEKDPIVLEFDHIREKKFTISRFSRDHKLEDVQMEVEKCEVRCANCHRRKTALQFGWHKNMPL